MTTPRSAKALACGYAITIFLSAFLLFQVQPLIGKYILPWFGGGPAVWTTCMLVFQVLLFAGYAYAHLTTRFLTPKQQGLLHIGFLAVALLTLPIAPDSSWKPTNSDWPAVRIILLTTCCIGLPYFLLSSTGPLVQSWFARTNPGDSPYRLYSLSNLGSLLALVSYPFAVEPAFSKTTQSTLWSVLFGGFVALCSSCAVFMWMRTTSVSLQSAEQTDLKPVVRPASNTLGLWFGLAFTPSTLLLATTNQVCLDVAVIPFLWVLPLALYLITFILCFDSDRWYSRRPYTIAAAVLLPCAIYLSSLGSNSSWWIQLVVYFAAMFSVCMVCHGELVRLKPDPQYLTTFYLTISAGGAAGGLFVGLLAPLVFASYYELHFGIAAFAMLYLWLRLREDQVQPPLPAWCRPLVAPLLTVLMISLFAQFGRNAEGSLAVARNFYGVLKIEQRADSKPGFEMLRMAHGRIEHGSQFVSPERRRIPTAYYASNSGIGQVLRHHHADQPRHVGVVGLGVGTLAAYGKSGDRFRMYEINPDVITLAEQHFSFLKDCPADLKMVTGDARLALEFEPVQQFDILVLDAFSGDAIPAHLLTKEAIAVYLSHLKADGILACHISNLHFDLRPVVEGIAREFDLSSRIVITEPEQDSASFKAVWAVLSRQSASVEGCVGSETSQSSARAPIIWTDDRSNLFEVMW